MKAMVADLDALKEKLTEKGCKFGDLLVQEDRVFLLPGVTLDNFSPGDTVLRLRKSGGETLMTLKMHAGGDLDKIEYETVVMDYMGARNILESMGYEEISFVQKERAVEKYEDMEICLDRVDELGSFVEIEVTLPDSDKTTDSEAVQEKLWQFLASLGVQSEDQVFHGYDVLMHHKKQGEES